jgi:heptosyltransferase-1
VVVPRLPLPRLAALCARIAVAVGGDTGPIHLAAAQGAATASFFGPTVAARSAPRGAAHRTVQAVVPCAPCFGRRCRNGEFVCTPGLDAAAIAGAATAALGHRGQGAVVG